MRILLAPFGSEGDVNPFLWLASGLRQRGHDVRLLLSPHYGWLADQRGLAWTQVGETGDFLAIARNPLLWDPRRGTEAVVKGAISLFPATRKAFEETGGDFDLVVTATMGMAVSFLAEARGIPRLQIHLQPICLRSAHETPLYLSGLEWLNSLPAFAKRALFGLGDWQLNRLMRKRMNDYRRDLGLPPIRNVFTEVISAGEWIVGLFPDWFAEPQRDWPANFRLFGFPLDPAPESAPLDPALEAFLAAGKPPILWCHGSANFAVASFQACALEASRELGERCLLVSLEPPAQALPPGAFHVSHVRFESIFPRCRAVVNHGGIGTMSKAMAAGLPQLVVPLAHDQPDNAARAQKLGIGATLPLRNLTSARAAAALRGLLASPGLVERCRAIQLKIQRANPRPELCDWIERSFPLAKKNQSIYQ